MTKKTLLLLLPLLLLLVWLPHAAEAQGPINQPQLAVIDWGELETENFLIVYANSVEPAEGQPAVECDCGIEYAERYATFIDDIYTDLVAVFGVELETPINLRLFPTEQSYFEVNPLAEAIPGVIAHALNNRQEIAVALPRTTYLNEDQLINNMRHEMTHLFASLISDSKLKTGFQEGIAQYLEKPTEDAEYEPAVLRKAFEQGRLLTWAELDEAKQVYSDPQVAYPQSLSIVSFLVDRYGFETFVKFLRASATEPGYRSALEVAYGKSADELEKEWLAYLPEYFDGRWQINALYTYDLTRVTQLVERGAYTDAADELTGIVSLLETTDQTEKLTEAEALLAQAHQGQTAGAIADEARQALQTSDYAGTIAKGNEAIAIYEQLGYRDRIPEIQLYIQRAQIGQDALTRLDQGEQLLDTYRFFEAEDKIYEATVLLQSLGNSTASQRGTELLQRSADQQSIIAYAVLIVAGALLLLNGVRRIISRFSANPLEVEFS